MTTEELAPGQLHWARERYATTGLDWHLSFADQSGLPDQSVCGVLFYADDVEKRALGQWIPGYRCVPCSEFIRHQLGLEAPR